MQPESLKLLQDVLVAGKFVLDKTQSRNLDSYIADEVLRAAIERQFEIMGEALNRLTKGDTMTAGRIPDVAKIIAFRNVLIHGYDAIDHRRVWDAVQNHLPKLVMAVETLLHE